LKEATSRYHASLPGSPGAEHLAARGLFGTSAERFVDKLRIGYVADPLPGHEMYRGMLCIPYLRQGHDRDWSVVSLRFRCIEDHAHQGHGKYNTQPGDRPRLYNTRSLIQAHDTIAICEGEFDTITALAVGVEAVGVPGATSWQPHFRDPFLGYETVYVLADGDEAGYRFARTIAETLPNAKIIPCPPGEDVNSLVVNHGKQALLERLK
jgi:hypothetical protein